MVGVAMPPKADDPGLDPNFLGDRPRAASGRRQKNYPRPLQIALQRHRRATARLKHLAIFPRKVDFSRFGYHPYLESRLTIQEKWVLGSSEGVATCGDRATQAYEDICKSSHRAKFLPPRTQRRYAM